MINILHNTGKIKWLKESVSAAEAQRGEKSKMVHEHYCLNITEYILLIGTTV